MEQQKQKCAAESVELESTGIINIRNAKEQGLKRYFTGIPCKRNHISQRSVSNKTCLMCASQTRKEKNESLEKSRQRSRDWYKKNKKKAKLRISERYKIKRDDIAEYNKKYYLNNKDKMNKQAKEWRESNKDYLSDYFSDYNVKNKKVRDEWRKKNPEQAFIRNSLKRIISNWRGGRKKMEQANGYTYEQLRSHLQSRFKNGMTWDNYGEWHIDHIKPISVFIKDDITNPKIINALVNLQPLWASENLTKGASHENSK